LVKALKITGIVLSNLALVFGGLILYYAWTEPMIKHSDNRYHLEMNLMIILFIVGVLVVLIWKPFRKFGIGIVALTVPTIMFLLYYLNKEVVVRSSYEQYKYGRVHVGKDGGMYMSVGYRPYGLNIPLSLENCVSVDSIRIRINHGLLGMDVMTNDAEVIENFNCDHQDLDTTTVLESHIKIGKSMFEKRCFQSAMYHLNHASKIDTSNPELHFIMGLINMFWKDYERALLDYYQAYLIRSQKVDTTQYEILGNPDLVQLAEQLFSEVEQNKLDGIGELSKTISDLGELKRTEERMEYCLERMQAQTEE
jgi:hypothetical protein